MKQLYFLLILLFCSTLLFGQKKNRNIPPSPNENRECRKKHNYSFSDRMKNYPFNIAKSVLVVSYNYHKIGLTIYVEDSTPEYNAVSELPIINDTLSYSNLTQKVALNKTQIDSLTNILYNYDYKNSPESIISYLCDFGSHKAIIFLDSNEKMIEYIELGLECLEIKISSPKVKTGNFCYGKSEHLLSFFKQIGLSLKDEEDFNNKYK